jgi:type II secretory pathway pseudopilin PulG
MVVIALIAIITLFAVPGISGYFKASLGSTTRELASVIKESYSSALLTKQVYRVAFDLDKNQYWVESGPHTLQLEMSKELKQDFRRDGDRKRTLESDKKSSADSQFTQNKLITRQKRELAGGVIFEDIVTQQAPEGIQKGMAYTHIFPHGFTEKTLIHLKDPSNHQVSLAILPLIGKTKIIDHRATPEEVDANP